MSARDAEPTTTEASGRVASPAVRPELANAREVLGADAIPRVLRRIASEIIERCAGVESLALVGVRTRGVPLARRLAQAIAEAEGTLPAVGELDIALYRDDVFSGRSLPEVRPTHLPFDVAGRELVLVDDVIFTGRTTRAALDALMDWGRPRCIRLAALIDRGHRELPLHADFCGLKVETARDELVRVHLTELDGRDGVEVGRIGGGTR